jgi:hypothetical protein
MSFLSRQLPVLQNVSLGECPYSRNVDTARELHETKEPGSNFQLRLRPVLAHTPSVPS